MLSFLQNRFNFNDRLELANLVWTSALLIFALAMTVFGAINQGLSLYQTFVVNLVVATLLIGLFIYMEVAAKLYCALLEAALKAAPNFANIPVVIFGLINESWSRLATTVQQLFFTNLPDHHSQINFCGSGHSLLYKYNTPYQLYPLTRTLRP